MKRRDILKAGTLAGLSLGLEPSFGTPTSVKTPDLTAAKSDSIPKKGTTFNESIDFIDELSLKPSKRLTQFRDHNMKPTYHIDAGFTKDSKHMIFCTWNRNGGSALIRVNVETGDCYVLDDLPAESKIQFDNGNGIAVMPETNKVAVILSYSQIRLYDIDNGEYDIIIEAKEGETFSAPVGSSDGKNVYVNIVPQFNRLNYSKMEKKPKIEGKYYRYNIDSGRLDHIKTDHKATNNHLIAHPTRSEILLIDRDYPPLFSGGGDYGKSPRTHLFNTEKGTFTPIYAQNENKFQLHANFSHDGKHVYYHGVSGRDASYKKSLNRKIDITTTWDWYKRIQGVEHYIGVADLNGNTIWEGTFPYFYYGHTCSHSTKNILIIDGLTTPDQIIGIHWEELDEFGNPRMEVLGKHGSNWNSGQLSHPHCQMSRNGKWMSYNRGVDPERSDIYLLQMQN